MKTYLSYSFILAAAACSLATGQTAYTTPVGYVSQTCLPASDTIVGIPIKVATAGAGALSAAPNTSATPGFAIISLSGSPGFTVNSFQNTYYAKFTSGISNGKFYVITANSSSGLTLDLNGDTLAASTGDTVIITKLWTLGELFVPSASTTLAATTGNAIVASTSGIPAGRRTEVLLPDTTTAGINLASSGTFFIYNGAWRKVGQPITNSYDTIQLWPDNDFIIRHPSTVTAATTYTASGEVDSTNFVVALTTRAASKQDNFIGLPRPIDVSLNGLALGGTSAFLTSASGIPSGRRDELLVFNNSVASKNKAPSATYFYYNGAWRKSGSVVTTDFGTSLITSGSGFIIRKYQVTGGPTQFWNNTPSY
jgi:uncharacterized protein (TIGR02597 family)